MALPLHPKHIINIPTKNHRCNGSRPEYVSLGLDGLVKAVSALGIRSVALPALGCGLGGLDWETVRALTIKKLSALPETDAFFYAPAAWATVAARRRAYVNCREHNNNDIILLLRGINLGERRRGRRRRRWLHSVII